MSEDSGFGEIFSKTDNTDSFDLTVLKKKILPINPMFSYVNGDGMSIDNLANEQDGLLTVLKNVFPPVLPKGNKESKFIFLADLPSGLEEEEGEKFPPDTDVGNCFEQMLDILCLKRQEVYITPYVFCRDIERGISRDTVLECLKIHKKEFQGLPNMEYIFTLGTRPFQMITGLLGSSVSYVGKYIEAELFGKQVKIIPLNSPAYLVDSDVVREKNFNILEKIKS